MKKSEAFSDDFNPLKVQCCSFSLIAQGWESIFEAAEIPAQVISEPGSCTKAVKNTTREKPECTPAFFCRALHRGQGGVQRTANPCSRTAAPAFHSPSYPQPQAGEAEGRSFPATRQSQLALPRD